MKLNKDQAKQVATILTALASMMIASATAAYFNKHLTSITQLCGIIGLAADLYWIAVVVLGEKYVRI